MELDEIFKRVALGFNDSNVKRFEIFSFSTHLRSAPLLPALISLLFPALPPLPFPPLLPLPAPPANTTLFSISVSAFKLGTKA